jgi:hypothetical protein
MGLAGSRVPVLGGGLDSLRRLERVLVVAEGALLLGALQAETVGAEGQLALQTQVHVSLDMAISIAINISKKRAQSEQRAQSLLVVLKSLK